MKFERGDIVKINQSLEAINHNRYIIKERLGEFTVLLSGNNRQFYISTFDITLLLSIKIKNLPIYLTFNKELN